MTESSSSVSVPLYLAGLGTSIALGTLAYVFFVAPLLFGDPMWMGDTSAPDGQMRAIGRGLTIPTLLGIVFVTIAAVVHGWLYANYPRLLNQ